MRIVNLLLVTSLVALAFLLYQVKHESRDLQARVASLRLDIKNERDAIAVLRAEWSHLNHPERLERLARKHLGLTSVQARQVVTLDQFLARRRDEQAPDANKPLKPLAQKIEPGLRHTVRAIR